MAGPNMHLRMSTQRRNGKTYRYAQLVESYRREDGRPTVRVVKHLGALPDAVIEALRIALQAARTGDALVRASEVVAELEGSIVADREDTWVAGT